MSTNNSPIGILDSGVGGLSVLRHIHTLLPQENLLYFADQAHVPYGQRSRSEIQTFSAGITRFLIQRQAKLIVVACNTASAAALNFLRQTFPDMPFVGMEPAVKPAAQVTRSGKVGVLATAGTFDSQRYAALMSRYAHDVQVFEDSCYGLVPLIEAGEINSPFTEALLRKILAPLLAVGVDTLVLGCTHYPFVQPLIERIVTEDMHETGPIIIIDPAPAVARQTQRVLERGKFGASVDRQGTVQLFTSGAVQPFKKLSRRLLGRQVSVETAVWQGEVIG